MLNNVLSTHILFHLSLILSILHFLVEEYEVHGAGSAVLDIMEASSWSVVLSLTLPDVKIIWGLQPVLVVN